MIIIVVFRRIKNTSPNLAKWGKRGVLKAKTCLFCRFWPRNWAQSGG
jgi:hypothetical protein